jgi:hypothetical protein
MADFDYDLDEMVTWGSGGPEMTLQEAVQRFMELPAEQRVVLVLFRDRGKDPATLGSNEIEVIASEIS